MIGREVDLLAGGFHKASVVEVAIPHYVWKVELDIEFDRQLRLAEEAILSLVGAGLGEPSQIAALLGLAGEPIVPRYLADLIVKAMLTRKNEQIQITAMGRRSLAASMIREEHTCSVELRHDPYRDELRWELDDELRAHEIERSGPRPLPLPGALTHGELELRHRDLQELITRDGLPFQAGEKTGLSQRRELIRVRPTKHYVAYRAAELEVWHRPDTEELRWRLIRGGGEEREMSERLTEMERDGLQIIPFEDARSIQESPTDIAIKAAVATARHPETPPRAHQILQVADHRPALAQAIDDARRELVIVSPWLRRSAVDEEMISWFRNSLDRHRELRVFVGYGISDEGNPGRVPSRRDRESHDEALRRLRELERSYARRIQLVELGNTHQKVVVVDTTYAIVSSFNFLSFKPQPGKMLRQETGMRFTDPDAVKTLKRDLLNIFRGSLGL